MFEALANAVLMRLRARRFALLGGLRRYWRHRRYGVPAPGEEDRRDFGRYLQELNRVLPPPAEAHAGVAGAACEGLDLPGWAYFATEGARLVEDGRERIVAALQRHPRCKVVYADHYCVDPGTALPHSPSCSPAYDPVRWRQEPYAGPGFLVHRSLLQRMDGLQAIPDREAALQAVAAHAKESEVLHLPLFLHYVEKALPVAEAGPVAGALSEPAADRRPSKRQRLSTGADGTGGRERPSVSVMIPTRDGMPLLERCVEGALAELDGEGADGELLIVDNGSRDPDTCDFLARFSDKRGPRVRVLRHDAPFNFSALNNLAARQADGEFLLLLNDDVVPRQAGWLKAMLAWMRHTDVGAVGARLLYADGRLQHAGVVLGLGGIAAHPGAGMDPGDPALRMLGMHVTRSVSAVTAACLLTRRDLYWTAGGLNETALGVAYNDVDYCLKLRRLGYRTLCTPDATLLHHESASRGADTSFTRRIRLAREAHYMRKQWGQCLREDPYYSPHLSLETAEPRFRFPPRVPPLGRTSEGPGGAITI